MYRFYHEPLADGALSDTIALDRDQARHALKALRLEIGAEVELFDGCGHTATGHLVEADPRKPHAVIEIGQVHYEPPVKPALVIASAIPKGPLADQMVVQLSQLGVDRLIPLRTQRSIVEPNPVRLVRFGRTVIESAKQSRRAHAMQVAATTSLEVVLEQVHPVRLIAHGGAAGPVQGLAFELHRAASALVLVGPEGGFTDDEVAMAERAACRRWRLGPHILRIETAAVAAAAVVRYLAST